MTVRINLDLPSAERLIGGDTEAEITLRNGIVQTFTRSYLKDVVNQDTFRKLMGEVKKATIEEFRAQLPLKKKAVSDGWTKRYQWWFDTDLDYMMKLKEAIEHTAKTAVQSLIDEQMANIRKTAIERIERESERLLKSVSSSVHDQLTAKFNKMVQVEVNRRILAAAKQEVT